MTHRICRNSFLTFVTSLILVAATSCGGGSTSSPPANPVFLSTPPSAADEESVYTYTASASDPAGGAIAYKLTTAPTGTMLSGATLRWTPSSAQSRQSNSFAIRATTAAGASAVQAWTVIPNGVVHIRWIQTRIWDGGTINTPVDMTHTTLAAIVPNAMGGFDRIDGHGFPDGTGLIAHVPAGFYWFDDSENTFCWTDSSSIDLSSYPAVWGRPDVEFAPSYEIDFTMTGLNPWQSSDQLRWRVINAAEGNDFFVPQPAIGTTTATASTIAHARFDASKGDQQVLYQLGTHSIAGAQVLTLDKAFGPAPISGSGGPGVPFSVSAPLSDLPRSTLRATFRGSAFQALVTTMNPNAVAGGTGMDLRVELGPQPFVLGPELAVFNTTAIASDLDLGDVSYGNPFVSSWPVVLHYGTGAHVYYAPPGLPAGQMGAGIQVYTTNLPTANSPLQPIVGPPVNPRINGADFFQDQTGVGLTPILEWNQPTVGSAAGYQVAFCYFEDDIVPGSPHFLGFTCVGSLYTNTTTVTVPPGMLQAGKYYFVTLRAISQPGVDISTAPFKTALPRGTAEAISGIISR